MALQFVLGGSGSGKSEYVQNIAIKLAMEDRNNNILMIVPDQFTMQTQWQMANRHPDGGIINIDVLSFSRLPRRVFEEVGQPKRMLLDDTGKCLLIKRGATKVKDKLHVLSKGMDNVGWSGEVKSVLSEFMQYDIKPEDLERYIGDCTSLSLKRKLEDLKLLYEVFLKECEEKYITREEILDLFIERLPLSKKTENSIVFFDGFTGFTPIQIKAVVAILKKAKDVIITLPFDNDLSENPFDFSDKEDRDFCLFDLTKRNIRDLIKASQDDGIEVKKVIRLTENFRHKGNPELAHIEKNLFRKKPRKINASGAITINRCGDIENECHNLCKALISEIKTNNYKYSDMALICADMEKYKKPLEKYLDRYNIPYYMDENRSVINNPLVKYILSITEILRNNFKVEDVLKMLRTGIAPFSDEEIDVIENYVYARGIKGINKWKNEFVFQSHEQKINGEALDEINSLRERFISVFEDITKDGIRKRKLSVWIEELYGILEKTEVAERLSTLSKELKEEGLIVESKEYEGVYNKVIEVFDSLTDLMGDEDYTIKELSDILKVGFSEIRVGVLPQKVDSLLVGDMQRTRLKETKALFIVGVNDGNIPKSGASGGLLSVPDKEELKQADCHLSPTNDELAFIEQLYIYLTLTKPTDKLYLSFATIGGKGDSLIPSYLIDIVTKMFDGLKEENVTDERPQINISDYKEEAARLLGRYISGLTDSKEEDRLFDIIGKIRSTENGKEWCEKIIENTFREYIPTPLAIETAKALYGEMLSVSVSTLEQFARCRFAHFAIYGLGLSEREEYGLENIDIGNMSHDVLDKVGKALRDKGLDFSTNETEMMEREIDLAVERIANEYNGDILQSDEKTKYYSKQLARIMKRTAKTLGYQLSKGRFKPEMFEAKFERNYELDSLPDDYKGVSLRGKIDRADIYEDKSGNEYVKIMDYKSSAKSIDPKSIEEGLSLQLAIYMKNAIAILQERHPDKKVLPAAMLYYAIDDPFVEKRENVEEEILKSLIPNGAIVSEEEILTSLDSTLLEAGTKSLAIKASRKKDNDFGKSNNLYTVEEFEALLNNAEEKAKELSKDILLGSIDIDPYEEKNKNACQYCSLKGFCGFDQKIKGYAFRNLEE